MLQERLIINVRYKDGTHSIVKWNNKVHIKAIFKNLPTLDTERLTIRKLAESDANDIFEYAKNPNVAEFTTWNAHKNIGDSKQFIEFVINEYNIGNPQTWGIVLKETNKLIGTIGFLAWNESINRVDFAYALSQNYWNKGLVSEAVKKVIGFGFEELKFNKITAHCVAENVTSEKVMQKIGMKYEGLFKQHEIKNGKLLNIKCYAIMLSEWKKPANGYGWT